MSPFRNRLKTPEEIELEKKRVELSFLRQQLAERESVFAALRAEIRMFEQVYQEILGSRIAQLEDLEWQLNGLLGSAGFDQESVTSQKVDAFAHFHPRTDLLDDEAVTSDAGRKTLKSIYREVAKAIHPDLAPDEGERQRRQELMAVANQAYTVGDRKTLEDILAGWEEEPVLVSELDVALELVRIIREIARVQQNQHALSCQIDELKATDIYHFKLRVDEALGDGIDLLAEMAAAIEHDIARTQNRLAVLRGEEAGAGARRGPPLETRIISFPAERSCGTLYERNRGSVDYRDWKPLGNARGSREVFLDKALRLDFKSARESDLAFLNALKPDDLHSLFLYDVADAALQHLAQLSGLEELYLSNTTVSDEGLLLLAPLSGLKRLYIYHTAISDFGLMNLARLHGLKSLTCSGTNVTENGLSKLRQIFPGCKVTSFKWRYDQ